MKILSVYISAFGVLKDKKIDFNENLNTIKQENGWGKSTLAVFIKSMFYGLDDSKRSVAENERTKYLPWDYSGKFGGSLEFEKDGKVFRIERNFGLKSTDDIVRLFDVASGKEYSKTEELGKRIFQIDEEGFFSTVYFSQKDLSAKANSSLTSKFNSLNIPDDEQAFEKAIKNLDDKCKEYKIRGDKGILAQNKRDKFELESKIKYCKALEDTCVTLREQIAEDKELVATTEKRIEELLKKERVANEYEKTRLRNQFIDDKKSRKLNIETQIEQLNQTLNGTLVDEKDIKERTAMLDDYNNAVLKEQVLTESINEIKNSVSTKIPTNNFSLIFAILSAIILVSGVVLAFFSLIIGLTLVGVGICLAVVSLLLFLKNKKSNRLDLQKRLEEKTADLFSYAEIRTCYEKAFNDFLKRFYLPEGDYAYKFNKLTETVKSYKTLKSELEEVEKSLIELTKDGQESSIAIDSDYSLNVIKEKIASERSLLDSRKEILLRRKERLNTIENEMSSHSQLQEDLARLIEKNKEDQRKYDVLSSTKEFLEKAYDNLKIKYRSPLEEGLNKYLSKVLNGAKKQLRIDVDFTVTAIEDGQTKHADYYSKGYKNLFEICKRFALIDVLFVADKPFIILDDPFVNLDDEKTELMLSVIKTLSNDYQILYFICHESRRVIDEI